MKNNIIFMINVFNMNYVFFQIRGPPEFVILFPKNSLCRISRS